MKTQYIAYAATAKIERRAKWLKSKTKKTEKPRGKRDPKPPIKTGKINLARLEIE